MIPEAEEKVELYLFPSCEIAPTSIKDGAIGRGEGVPTLGPVIPSNDSIEDISPLSVSGSFGQLSPAYIQDINSESNRFQVHILHGGSSYDVKANTGNVGRFYMTPNDGRNGQYSITGNWNNANLGMFNWSDGSISYNYVPNSQSVVLINTTGEIFLYALVSNGSAQNGNIYLICMKLDPETYSDTWPPVYVAKSATFLNTYNLTGNTKLAVAGCLVRNTAYLAVVSQKDPTEERLVVHLFSHELDSANIVEYQKDIFRSIFKQLGIKSGDYSTLSYADKGIALTYDDNKLILAMGVNYQSDLSNSSTIQQNILFAETDNFRNWSSSASGDYQLLLSPIASGTQNVGIDENERIVAFDRYEEDSSIIALATESKIYISEDNGGKWTATDNFLSRNDLPNKTGMSIKAVKIVPAETTVSDVDVQSRKNYVVYAGGNNFLMRSTDGGETWKVIVLGKGVIGLPSFIYNPPTTLQEMEIALAQLKSPKGRLLAEYVTAVEWRRQDFEQIGVGTQSPKFVVPIDITFTIQGMDYARTMTGGASSSTFLFMRGVNPARKSIITMVAVAGRHSHEWTKADIQLWHDFDKANISMMRIAKAATMENTEMYLGFFVQDSPLGAAGHLPITPQNVSNRSSELQVPLVSGKAYIYWYGVRITGISSVKTGTKPDERLQASNSTTTWKWLGVDRFVDNQDHGQIIDFVPHGSVTSSNAVAGFYLTDRGKIYQWKRDQTPYSPQHLDIVRDIASLVHDFGENTQNGGSVFTGLTAKFDRSSGLSNRSVKQLFAFAVGWNDASRHGGWGSTGGISGTTVQLQPSQTRVYISNYYDIEANDNFRNWTNTIVPASDFSDVGFWYDYDPETDQWVIYTSRSIHSASVINFSRVYPSLIPTSVGIALLMTDVSLNTPIIWLRNRASGKWSNADISAFRIKPTSLQPYSLSRYPEGIYVLQYKQSTTEIGCLVSDDECETFMRPHDPSQPADPSELTTAFHILPNPSWSDAGHISVVGSPDGRIVSLWGNTASPAMSFAISRYAERMDMGLVGIVPAPMLPGKQWTGFGNILLHWNGTVSTGDIFSLTTFYQYGKQNNIIESPQFITRSGPYTIANLVIGAASEVITPNTVTVEWQSDNGLTLDALGIIKSNYPFATLKILDGEFSSTTDFAADHSNYTRIDINSIVRQGIIPRFGESFTSNDLCMVSDPSAAFEPHQFARTNGVFYLAIAQVKTTSGGGISPTAIGKRASNANHGPSIEVRRIVDNTENMIIYEGGTIWNTQADGVPGDYPDHEYIIYTDRMYTDGFPGTHGNVYGYPARKLAGTAKMFTKKIAIQIPIFLPPEGYIQSGKIIPCLQYPIKYAKTMHGFSTGYRWATETRNSVQEGVSGVSQTHLIGQPYQSFSLQYDQIEDWQTRVFKNSLHYDLMKPFFIIFSPDDPQSLAYVRLATRPEYTNENGLYFSYGLQLTEVV